MEDVQARTLIQGGVGSLSVRPRTPGTSAYEMSTELILRLARVASSLSPWVASVGFDPWIAIRCPLRRHPTRDRTSISQVDAPRSASQRST